MMKTIEFVENVPEEMKDLVYENYIFHDNKKEHGVLEKLKQACQTHRLQFGPLVTSLRPAELLRFCLYLIQFLFHAENALLHEHTCKCFSVAKFENAFKISNAISEY